VSCIVDSQYNLKRYLNSFICWKAGKADVQNVSSRVWPDVTGHFIWKWTQARNAFMCFPLFFQFVNIKNETKNRNKTEDAERKRSTPLFKFASARQPSQSLDCSQSTFKATLTIAGPISWCGADWNAAHSRPLSKQSLHLPAHRLSGNFSCY